MIFILIYIKNKYGWINLNVKPDFNALSQKNAALVHQICSLVTNSTDVIVLSMFCDLNTVSIYTVYNMIFAIVYNVIFSVNTGLLYALGQAYCKSKDYYCKFVDLYETYYVAIATALLLVSLIMIVPFLNLYTANADINYVDKYLPFMFFIVKLLDSFRNASLNTITVSGHYDDTKKHAIIESIINLTISLISVWKFGVVGVLIGTTIAFLYRCIISIRFVNKKVLKRRPVHSIKVIMLNIFLSFFSLFLLNSFNFNSSNYMIFFIKLVPLTIIILAIFIVINSITNYKQFELLKEQLLSILKRRS